MNAAFVAAMEDILEVYRLPYDEEYPVICMDEKPLQLVSDSRKRIMAKPAVLQVPGQLEKIDFEYIRNGTCNIFIFSEPLAGKRYTEAFERRTKIDWALNIKNLLDVEYPDAKKVILVLDNLNTHKISSLYEAFPPEEALRLSKRLEVHYTPKHGSWLNIAEIELSALSTQCLGKRRIDNLEELNQQLRKWYSDRNTKQKGVDWQFSVNEARILLKHVYPIPKF